jgi:acyl-CoA synthetase (AMP-forming)/AMP-acid ligase II
MTKSDRNQAMMEPWDRDWSGLADWSKLPRIAPTIPALLAHVRADHPERDVLVVDDRRTNYGELEAKSATFARQLLAAGIGKGGRVGIMLPNDETFLISWLGTVRIGAIAITLPSLAKAPEIAKLAAHADLQLLIAPRRYLHHDYPARLEDAFPAIAPLIPPYRLAATPFLRAVWFWCEAGDDCPHWAQRIDLAAAPEIGTDLLAAAEAAVHSSDPAGIIYTSGSTAEPKGVIHSQGSFIRNGLKLAASFGYEPGERAYASMPFFWVGGLTTTVMCLFTAGGTILASRKTGAELLDFIEAQRTTAVVSWPHIMRAMADDPSFPGRDWSAMRNGLFYETLPADRKPSDPTLMATPIGMTETNGPYTIVDRFLTEDQRGSLGRLMPGLEARLIDPDSGAVLAHWSDGDRHADSAGLVGVMHLRSDTMMLGMVKREASDVFTADGWYDSCDLISFKDGHIHYHGRADDLIKAHGANVSPREVEGVIAQQPGVAAVHAVGVPNATRGTVVGAVVVPEPDCALDPAAIRQACAAQLASYKVPRIILIRTAAELPVLPSSKVDRRALVTLLQEAGELA